MGSKFGSNWKDSLGDSRNQSAEKEQLLKRMRQRKHTMAKKVNKVDIGVKHTRAVITENQKDSNVKASVSKFPDNWLCHKKQKVNSSLRKVVLDIAASQTSEPCIKPFCFWPVMPANVLTFAVITSLTRYVNAKELSQTSPVFIYPFFPFDISRLNTTELNWTTARDHIFNVHKHREKGFSDVENGLLSFVSTASKNENKNIHLTCSDIAAINYFDSTKQSWCRKRNPFHKIRTTEVLAHETKRRLRNVRKQGEIEGIANLYGLPIDWDFDSSHIKKVLQNKNEQPEFLIDLSMAASRRVNGHTVIINKLLKGLKKLTRQFNGNLRITVLSDNPEAIIYFKNRWEQFVGPHKKSKQRTNQISLQEVKGLCNQGLDVTSRVPFKNTFSLSLNPHIHGQQHYQLCHSFYEHMKMHIGQNPELGAVTTLYKWLIQAGSSLISDSLFADFLERENGSSQTAYFAQNYSAPTLLTRASLALNQAGLLTELSGLLKRVQTFQSSQAETTDAARLLLNLLKHSAKAHPGQIKLMTSRSRLLQFAIDELFEKLNEPVPHIHSIDCNTLEGCKWLVINGFNDKIIRAIFMNTDQLSGIDWLLSLQDAKKLFRSLNAILEIPGLALFNDTIRPLCTSIESALGQFKQSPVLATGNNWPNESKSISGFTSSTFKPTTKLVFVDNSTFFLGESSELLRFSPSNIVAEFTRTKPQDLQVGDDVLLVDSELKSLFLSTIPEQYQSKMLGPEEVVSQYRKLARNMLANQAIVDANAAVGYSRSRLQVQFPQINEKITKNMLQYWCDGIFIDDVKSAPRAAQNERYFLDFSEAIGINRKLAEMSYRQGFCMARSSHISQGKNENLALCQVLIDRTVSRNYGIPEIQVDEIIELANQRINQISSITPV